jgi:hypothetical protein
VEEKVYQSTRPFVGNRVAAAGLGLRRETAGDGHAIGRRRFYLHAYTPGEGWSLNAGAPVVEFENGRLYVNGVRIVNPHITADHVTWSQIARDAHGPHYTAGHLHLHPDGIEAHGTVAIGQSHADAETQAVFATAIPSVTYATRISKAEFPADKIPNTLPDGDWEPGLELTIGYQQQIGQSTPSPVVTLGGQDVTPQSTWSVEGDQTILTIALNDSDCSFATGLYKSARVAFDALQVQPIGHGAVSAMCSRQPGAGAAWAWQTISPKAAPQAWSLAAVAPARREVRAVHLLAVGDDGLGVNELMTILPDDVVNDDANSMLMRNMKWAMGQKSEQRDWLQNFFSEAPPVITEPDQVQLVNKGLPWYQDKFAMAYLTQSFNSYKGPNAPEHRLDDDLGANLGAYLKTGLAGEKDFNVQHQGIYVDAYVGAKPRLQRYVNDSTPEVVGWAVGEVVFSRTDTSADLDVSAGTAVKTAAGIVYTTQAKATIKAGQAASDPVPVSARQNGLASVAAAGALNQFDGKPPAGISSVTNPKATTLTADSGGLKWAKKLFTTLTSGAQFVLMVNRVAGAAGDPKALGPVNNFACLLTALDPSGTIARDYFQSVMSGVLVKLVPQVVHRDKDTTMQWLPTAMQELLRKLADGELPNETDISQTQALEMYQIYLKNSAEISGEIGDLLQGILQSGLLKQTEEAEEAFATTIAQRWPKLAKASRFMFALGWIGAVSSVIVSLVKGDWKKMTAIEKAEFVTNIVQLTVTGFEAVPLIWQGVKTISLAIWNKLNECWYGPAKQEEIELERRGVADENTPLVQQEGEVIDELYSESEAGARTLGEGTIFERIFADGVFTGVLKCVGALAAAAMAGYSLWRLIEDVKAGGSVSTIVFDSLVFTANLLSVVCLTADLFVATSFLPIAGAVLAIAGIIVSILASFFEKPINPVDQWMVRNGIPFAKGLPKPPAKPTPAIDRLGIERLGFERLALA